MRRCGSGCVRSSSGKSLHIADKFSPAPDRSLSGTLTENKILGRVEDNIRRTGFTNIRAEGGMRGKRSILGKQADIVIADLPCSVLHHWQEAGYQVSGDKEDLEDLAELQKDILSVVWNYVKARRKAHLQHLYHRSSGK